MSREIVNEAQFPVKALNRAPHGQTLVTLRADLDPTGPALLKQLQQKGVISLTTKCENMTPLEVAAYLTNVCTILG